MYIKSQEEVVNELEKEEESTKVSSDGEDDVSVYTFTNFMYS